MAINAHDAIDKKILMNNLNPNNIKNKVRSETIEPLELLQDGIRATQIFQGLTEGGDRRYYAKDLYGFGVPSSFYDEESGVKEQLRQLYKNRIIDAPQDTTSSKGIEEIYNYFNRKSPISK